MFVISSHRVPVSMTSTIDLLLFLIAAILFGIAAFNIPARFNLIAAGLCFFTIPFILEALGAR
jgi:hypothetical protein